MRNQILINTTFNETRVALLENGLLSEFYVERSTSPQMVGNIYKGKVEKIVPGMQAAFVNIGSDKAGFISSEDVYDEPFIDLLPENEKSEVEEKNKNLIQEKIIEGQDVIVQVVKEPVNLKGPKLSSYIPIPGKCLVLISPVSFVGISHKIVDEKERQRLTDIISRHKPENLGFIARTLSENVSQRDIVREIKNLVRTWEKIRRSYERRKKPNLLFNTPGLPIRAVRDLISYNINEIILDSRDTEKEIKKYLSDNFIKKKIKISYYKEKQPLFNKYKIEKQLEHLYKKKVWLKSGGYLIIEETEGLTVIDINTGKYTGSTNQQKSLLKINLEAARESARQIRLRNLVGIIVIDFIDIKDQDLRNKIYNEFRDMMSTDRARTVYQDMSQFSVIQLTRQRTRESILNTLSDPCEICDGTGRIKSGDTIIYEIMRKVLEKVKKPETKKIEIEANNDIVSHILSREKNNLNSLQSKHKVKIDFNINDSLINKFFVKNR